MPMALNMTVSSEGAEEQDVTLGGTLRPYSANEMAEVRASLEQAARNTRGTLIVNLKRLRYMNNVAFLEINRFLRVLTRSRPGLRVKFVLSSVIPWAIPKFQVIAELYPSVSIEVYDKTLYPTQTVLEDDESALGAREHTLGIGCQGGAGKEDSGEGQRLQRRHLHGSLLPHSPAFFRRFACARMTDFGLVSKMLT